MVDKNSIIVKALDILSRNTDMDVKSFVRILSDMSDAELNEFLSNPDILLNQELKKTTSDNFFYFEKDNYHVWSELFKNNRIIDKIKYGTCKEIPGPMELLIGFTRLYDLPLAYYNNEYKTKFLDFVFSKVYGFNLNLNTKFRRSEIHKYYFNLSDEIYRKYKYIILHKHIYYSELLNSIEFSSFYNEKNITFSNIIHTGILDLPLLIYFSKIKISDWNIINKEFIVKFYNNIELYGNNYTKKYPNCKSVECTCFIDFKEPRTLGCKKLLRNLYYFMGLKKYSKVIDFLKSDKLTEVVHISGLIKDTLNDEKIYNYKLRYSIIEFIEEYINNIYIMNPSPKSNELYKKWKKNKQIIQLDVKYMSNFIKITTLIIKEYTKIKSYL